MNDLAEKALHVVQVAVRQVSRRPLAPLATVGFIAAALTVYAGGRIGATNDVVPLTSWFGLLSPANYRIINAIPGALMAAGIVVLLILWVGALELARRGRFTERQMWGLSTAWALPFVVGPPLLSTDVYSATANGMLARAGLDPYRYAATNLHSQLVAETIDPAWRGSPSTSGSLSTLTEHLAAAITGSHPLAMVIAFRVLAVAATIAIGYFAAELAGLRRVAAVALTVANPAVLLYVVSGCHLDGLMVALILAALACAGRRRWSLAIALACLASGVMPIAIVAVPAMIVAHAVGQRNKVSWSIAGRDVGVAAVTLVVQTVIVPDGLGWVRNISGITHEHTLYAPASLVSDLISWVIPATSYDDLAVGGRIAALLAAITVISYLLVTVLERPLERTIGYAFLGIGLLAPVIYPWYLLWGLICLAPGATRARRDWIIALSCVACVLAPVGFSDRTAEIVTAGAIAAIACGLVPRLIHWQRADARRSALQRTAPL